MAEKLLLILLSLLFLGTFMARNLIVKAGTGQRIKASDPLLTISIILTTLCIMTSIGSVVSESFYRFMGSIAFLRWPVFSGFGLLLFAASIVMGWFFSAQLKDAWRVGVHYDQKTRLVRSGIYGRIRNPYFLSYFVMFFSLFLVRPSLVLAILVAMAVVVFHLMVLKEEAYLASVHGKTYDAYKEKTGRYLPLFH